MLNRELLDMIVCPVTKTRLIYDQEKQQLISDVANLIYPVRDGIPVLLVEEASPLSEEDKKRFSELITGKNL